MTVRLVHLLAARGRDPATVCEGLGVSIEELSSAHARISYRMADALVEACVRELGAVGFSIALSEIFDASTYDSAALLLLSSATFGEGLERAFAYQRLWGDGERFSLRTEATGGVVRFRHPGKSATARAVLSEVALLETMAAAKSLVDPSTRAVAVRFAHASHGDADALAGRFGIEPTFGARETELFLSATTMTAPLHLPPGFLAGALEGVAQRSLAELPETVSLAARVRAICEADATALALSVADIARRLRMSSRTFQRRLAALGTSWADIVDDIRRERARLFALRGASDKEIAFLLGFSDPSALLRARRRWLGAAQRGRPT